MKSVTLLVALVSVLMAASTSALADLNERELRRGGDIESDFGWNDQEDGWSNWDDDHGDRFDRRRPGRSERIRIPVNQHYRGSNTLMLKQLIRRHTGMRMADYQLEQVNLIAKSRRGHGTANLYVANQYKDGVTVQMANGQFHSERPATYNPHMLIVRDGRRGRRGGNQAQGPWQIDLQGSIKVKNLVVFVKPIRSVQEPMRLELSMHTIVRGNQEFGLKQLIRQQYPRMRMRDYDLKRVRVVAKSRRGHATAELFVNGYSQDYGRIGMGNGDFHSPGGMDRVALRAGRNAGQGPWRLAIQGRVNLKKIVVVVEPKW